jgi:hypothetical protein
MAGSLFEVPEENNSRYGRFREYLPSMARIFIEDVVKQT